MAYAHADLPAQFTALAALTSGQYTDLAAGVGTFVGAQVGDWAFACACSHVLELSLKAGFGGGVGPVASISGLDTSVSWSSPPQDGTRGWWQATEWGRLYLASRATAPYQILMVAP